MAEVMSGPTLALGLRSDYDNTWDRMVINAADTFRGVVQTGVPSSNLIEKWGYGEPPKTFDRVNWGEQPASKAYRYRTFDTVNFRWMSDVSWLRRDRELGNLGDIRGDAERAANRAAQRFERILYQQLQGTVDPKLLPLILSAPDGAAWFSATDGSGAARFGATGGNIVTGQDITTGPGLRSAVFRAVERMLTFLDPEGEPAIEDEETKVLTVLIPRESTEVAAEAFAQTVNAQGLVTGTSNAGVSNVFMDAGYEIRVIGSTRLTVATTMFVFAGQPDGPVPLFFHDALGLESDFYDRSNSIEHKKRGIEEIVLEMWSGTGLNLPLTSLKVTV